MSKLLPPGVRIFIACEPADLRRSFDGLAAITKNSLKHDPLSGDLFVFRNRAGQRCKALLWDRTGWLMLYKRLEKGIFRFPVTEDAAIEIDSGQLRMLLDGIELGVSTRSRMVAR